jgi:hypothetical protein
MLTILPTLLAAGCLNEPRDPFTSTLSIDEEKRMVSISGNSAGHVAGRQSKFQLVVNNRSGENPWQGEFFALLMDQKEIVAEIIHETFDIPTGQEAQYWIFPAFPQNFRGSIGLGVVIPGCSSIVTTLWVGKKENSPL